MIFLSEFQAIAFRGIRNLRIQNLSHINLIVGDNNSGKTSVLESIMLLRNVEEFSNVINVVRLRDNNFYSPFRSSTFDNFLYLFDPKANEKYIAVEGKIKRKKIGMNLTGMLETVMVDYNEINTHYSVNSRNNSMKDIYEEKETAEFQGKINSYIGNSDIETEDIKFNPFTRLTGVKVSKPSILDIIYVAPTEHTSGNLFSRIIKNDSYKEIVLKVIQIFDKDIEDILYQKNEQTARPIEYIKHKVMGNMPLATYGDGIKKVLLLANSIAKAANGILLVDEIETAIHAKYYDDIFKFVIKACLQFNIQLFATTHSSEALDGFLATQYNTQNEIYNEENQDLIRVITFRKNKEKNKTDARILTGKEVFENRNNFGFEVRL
jgi:AAA15 family ATPase/GTPase